MSVKFKEEVINVETQWGLIPVQAIYNSASKVKSMGYTYAKSLSDTVALYVKKRDFKSVLAVLVDTSTRYTRKQKIQPTWYKTCKASILYFKNEEFLVDKFNKTEFSETMPFEDWLQTQGHTEVCVGDFVQVVEDIRTGSNKVVIKGTKLQIYEITPTQLRLKTADNYSYTLVMNLLQGKLGEVP